MGKVPCCFGKKLAILVFSIFTTGVLICTGVNTYAVTLDFWHVNFDLDDTLYSDTTWGAVDLTFTGDSDILYFNLAINSTWQVVNIPVQSIEGAGITQTMSYYFDLGTLGGSISYDYVLSNSVLPGMPGGSIAGTANQKTEVISSGVRETAIPPLAAPAPLVGGAVADNTKHKNEGFPNQQCHKNECTVAAISNSLQFLKKQFKLTVDDSELTIGKMKTAANWDNDGCWIDHNDGRPAGQKNAWWEDKNAYMKSKKIPVSTRKITDISKLVAEIDLHQDIELQGDWHTAAIVGITKENDGKWTLDIKHDKDQDNDSAGLTTETITYNPATGILSGSPGFFNGSTFRYAIVECPIPEPISIILLGSALMGLIGSMKRRFFNKN